MDRDLTDMTSGVLPCVMETRIHFKADNSYDFTTTCTAIIENRQGTYQCAEPVIVLDNDGDKMIFNYSNGQIKTTMSFNVSDLGLPLPIPSIDMECTFTKE